MIAFRNKNSILEGKWKLNSIAWEGTMNNLERVSIGCAGADLHADPVRLRRASGTALDQVRPARTSFWTGA